MNGTDLHQRARLLIEERALGIIGDADAAWLGSHLAECAQCAEAADEVRLAISLLRSEPVVAPPFLVSRTKARVRLRARELQDNAQRLRMLFLSVGLAAVLSMVTFYGGYLLYAGWSGWQALSGTAAIVSAIALVWFWIGPAVLLLAAALYGPGEWLRAFQQNGLERGFGNE